MHPLARHCHIEVGLAFRDFSRNYWKSTDVADINPARTDPGGGWSPVAMERPAQAGGLPGDIVVKRVHS